MPIQSTADHENRILHTVCRGRLTLQDIETYQGSAWQEPTIYGYNELYDFADSDYSDVSFGDLLTVAQNSSKLYMLDPDSRFAFLTHTPQHEEIADFYIAARSLASTPSREIRKFSLREEAMDWLLSE